MSEPQRVAADTRVTLHFTLRLLDGEVVDSTRERAPAVFAYGDGNLLPGFERALLGLQAGDRRAVVIEAKDGFGEYLADNCQRMERTRFAPDLKLVKGLMLSFADKKGELPGVIIDIEADHVVVDFNHPLAGRDLGFEVEILAVEAVAKPVQLRNPAPKPGANS